MRTDGAGHLDSGVVGLEGQCEGSGRASPVKDGKGLAEETSCNKGQPERDNG